MASSYPPVTPAPPAFHDAPVWAMVTAAAAEALLYAALSVVGVCLVALML